MASEMVGKWRRGLHCFGTAGPFKTMAEIDPKTMAGASIPEGVGARVYPGRMSDLEDAGPDPRRPPFDASRLVRQSPPSGAASFECPRCARVSYHPADVAFGYCGRCHDWTGDQ